MVGMVKDVLKGVSVGVLGAWQMEVLQHFHFHVDTMRQIARKWACLALKLHLKSPAGSGQLFPLNTILQGERGGRGRKVGGWVVSFQ